MHACKHALICMFYVYTHTLVKSTNTTIHSWALYCTTIVSFFPPEVTNYLASLWALFSLYLLPIPAAPANSYLYGFPQGQSQQVLCFSSIFWVMCSQNLRHSVAALHWLLSVVFLGIPFTFLLVGIPVFWSSCLLARFTPLFGAHCPRQISISIQIHSAPESRP